MTKKLVKLGSYIDICMNISKINMKSELHNCAKKNLRSILKHQPVSLKQNVYLLRQGSTFFVWQKSINTLFIGKCNEILCIVFKRLADIVYTETLYFLPVRYVCIE